MRRIGLLALALGLSLMWGSVAQSQQDEGPEPPVVNAVMFWAQGCRFCDDVINDVLPPLQQQYGEQLSILLLEVATDGDWESLQQIAAQFGIGDVGVPFLIIGDRVLMGAGQIDTNLPVLVKSHLVAGGIAMPEIPGLEDETAQEEALIEFHTPGVLEALDEDGDGNPEEYLYDVPSEEPVPGVRLSQFLSVQPATGSGDVMLIVSTSTGQRESFRYTLSIPELFAAHVDDLRITLAPEGMITMDVINPGVQNTGETGLNSEFKNLPHVLKVQHSRDADPEVAFNIDVEPGVYTTIMIGSDSVQMEGQELAAVMHVFEGFDYLRARRACTQPTIYRACIMAMVQTYPAHATEADCDYLAPGSMDYLACRAILTSDPWECSRIGDDVSQLQCYDILAGAMQRRCQYLTGDAEAACLLDAAVAVGSAELCASIPAEHYAQRRSCEARILQDTAPCQSISDVTQRQACCAIFQTDADQYAACMGDQEVASSDQPNDEGETLTLGEVLGTEGSAEDAWQYGAFGPPPAAPSLDYLMNPAFYAEYTCERQAERPRFIASEGHFFYSIDTERSYPLLSNLIGVMIDQRHEEFTMASYFVLGTPGLWMPLDGSVYSLSAVTEPWATDADSFDRYSALDLRPSAEPLTVIGNTLDTIRYEGSYTEEVVIDRRNSTFTDGYYSRSQTFVFRAWYDQRTGLLVRSHFEQQPVSCVREGDYADETCPQPIELICTLADTSLPLGR